MSSSTFLNKVVVVVVVVVVVFVVVEDSYHINFSYSERKLNDVHNVHIPTY